MAETATLGQPAVPTEPDVVAAWPLGVIRAGHRAGRARRAGGRRRRRRARRSGGDAADRPPHPRSHWPLYGERQPDRRHHPRRELRADPLRRPVRRDLRGHDLGRRLAVASPVAWSPRARGHPARDRPRRVRRGPGQQLGLHRARVRPPRGRGPPRPGRAGRRLDGGRRCLARPAPAAPPVGRPARRPASTSRSRRSGRSSPSVSWPPSSTRPLRPVGIALLVSGVSTLRWWYLRYRGADRPPQMLRLLGSGGVIAAVVLGLALELPTSGWRSGSTDALARYSNSGQINGFEPLVKDVVRAIDRDRAVRMEDDPARHHGRSDRHPRIRKR